MATSSISLIRKRVHIRVLAFGGIVSLLLIATGHMMWVLSLWLGILFSGLIFTSLTRQNEILVQSKSKKNLFFGFLLRFGLYAVPLSLTFSFPKYLNIFVVLLSLLTYQVHYVMFELKYFWQHYKNRQSRNDTK